MVARGLCEGTVNRLFTLLVAVWLKTGITLPKDMITAQCTALSDVLWPVPGHGEGTNMTQLYTEAETKVQILERQYAVTK